MLGVTPSKDLAEILKRFVRSLLSPWKIKYDQSIYNQTRLLRIHNTKHSKTGLYKALLTPDEILNNTIQTIKVKAAKPRTGIKLLRPIFNSKLAALYKIAEESVKTTPRINGQVMSGDTIPKYIKLCYLELQKGVSEGERAEAAFRLACYFKKQGFSYDMVGSMLQTWNAHNSPPLEESHISSTVNSAFSGKGNYDYGCNDSILSKHCNSSCYLLKSKTLNNSDEPCFKSIDECERMYEDYIENLDKRLCRITIPIIGDAMRGIAPGEVLTFLARSGVGKTAFLIYMMLCINCSHEFPMLFFTMEQPLVQVFERMVQMVMGLRGTEVEKAFKDKQKQEYLNSIIEKTTSSFRNVYVVEEDRLTVEGMAEIVRQAEHKLNKKIGVVFVDYLGRMKCSGKNFYEMFSQNALNIKSLAKELDVAVICASQVSRKGGDGSKEVFLDSARDSGQIEEAADFIIGMWRPDIKSGAIQEEEKLSLTLLKNRKGPQNIETSVRFNKPILRFDCDGPVWNGPMDVEAMEKLFDDPWGSILW